MKRFGSVHSKNHRFHAGFNLHRVAFGIGIDRYSFNIDFLFFWFGIEW
jgi:hypothetical protein